MSGSPVGVLPWYKATHGKWDLTSSAEGWSQRTPGREPRQGEGQEKAIPDEAKGKGKGKTGAQFPRWNSSGGGECTISGILLLLLREGILCPRGQAS